MPVTPSRNWRDSLGRPIYSKKCLERQLLELLLYRRRAKDDI
jgi:hypothetical protein